MDDWAILETTLTGLRTAAANAPAGTSAAALRPLVEALAAEHAAAAAAVPRDEAQRARLQRTVDRLWQRIESTAGQQSWAKRLLTLLTSSGTLVFAIMVFALVMVVLFVRSYLNTAGWEALGTIEGTRPVLTVAAMAVTLAFGGGLIFSALFSDEAPFNERFRMAREIFLVFSGVFGTVVGFHFGAGAGEGRTGGDPPRLVGILGGPSTLSVAFATTSPPLTVELDLDGQQVVRPSVAAASSPLQVSIAPADAKRTYRTLKVALTDSRGRTTERRYGQAELLGFGYSVADAAAPASGAASRPR